MINDPKDGFALRANHDQDLHSIHASVLGARASHFELAMGTFHVGNSDFVSAVASCLVSEVY